MRQFQLTAARRRLDTRTTSVQTRQQEFQLTAARRRLDGIAFFDTRYRLVSTHSRPKAAGSFNKSDVKSAMGFNSQPPEGGWRAALLPRKDKSSFQLTAARRRLVKPSWRNRSVICCFNSQPPEGGWPKLLLGLLQKLMFQLTAARRRLVQQQAEEMTLDPFQLTAARRRLGWPILIGSPSDKFQLTAARRRLA